MELPSELLQVLVERGQILYSNIFTNIDHPKFFVIIGVTEDEVAGFFYINSRINTNVNAKEEQLRLQYPISKDDYDFSFHYILGSGYDTMDFSHPYNFCVSKEDLLDVISEDMYLELYDYLEHYEKN